MSFNLTTTTTFVSMECCDCACIFAITSKMKENLRETKKLFYCPNGHAQGFHKSTAQMLREQLEREKEARKRDEKMRDDLRERNKSLERSNSALKGSVTRKKNQLIRVKNGVCPCCNRFFKNVHRHMKSKHPKFDPGARS